MKLLRRKHLLQSCSMAWKSGL